MTGSNPTYKSKLSTKRHTLTDKVGIPLSVVITSTSTHDIKAVIEVIDKAVIKRPVVVSLSTIKERGSSSTYVLIEHTILN